MPIVQVWARSRGADRASAGAGRSPGRLLPAVRPGGGRLRRRRAGTGHVGAGWGAVFPPADRVGAMWVHGAMARAAADAGSDLDLSVAVRDDDFGAFASQWQAWPAARPPPPAP